MRKSIPRYIEIKEALYKEIASGRWPSGYMIPTEHQLAEQYGVSRMTARNAVKELERQGLLARFQGSGSFVTNKKKYRVQEKLISLNEMLRAEGYDPETHYLQATIEPAGDELASILNILSEDLVFRQTQLRLSNGEPIAIAELCIVYSFCNGLKGEDLKGIDYYKLMEDRFGVTFLGVDQTIRAVGASSDEAKLLDVLPGSPLLQTSRKAYDVDEKPVNFSIMTFKADKYAFRNTLKR